MSLKAAILHVIVKRSAWKTENVVRETGREYNPSFDVQRDTARLSEAVTT